MHPEIKKAGILTLGTLAFIAVGTVVVPALLYPVPAYPHEATNIQGGPLGWNYDPGCCRAATEPGGDCAPIDDKYVTTGPDGYHVNLPIGAHPKLINKGYSGVIPYSVARSSPEGNYHICLSTDGYSRFCFYAGAKGF